MELERMGEVLAKAVGWKINLDSHSNVWLVRPSKDGKTLERMAQKNWRPDEKPDQMMWVIEAMRAAGWTLVVTYSPTGLWVKYHKLDDKNHYHWETSDEPADDFCAEVCAVAARALESEDADG